jgi:hypothetical protein
MTKTYYLSDIYNHTYAWVFETLDEAQVILEAVKIADYKQDPYAIHEYIITEDLPF